jgi:hypothetical protein
MTPRSHPKFLTILLVLSSLGLILGACSDDGTGPAELQPLVGTWRATELTLTNLANPDTSVDLIEQGATFTLSILATGQYSASLVIFGQPGQEVGTVSVSGNRITIAPNGGSPTTGTWTLQGNTLIVDGDTEFDFNVDGIPEDASVHMELIRIDS